LFKTIVNKQPLLVGTKFALIIRLFPG